MFSPHTLIKDIFIITSYFVLLITSSITNITTANSRITTSDELCKEHNLSVIIPGAQRGRKYKEWQSEQNGSTWKTQLRRDINFCIKSASTYEDFLLLMRAKGYEIKPKTEKSESIPRSDTARFYLRAVQKKE